MKMPAKAPTNHKEHHRTIHQEALRSCWLDRGAASGAALQLHLQQSTSNCNCCRMLLRKMTLHSNLGIGLFFPSSKDKAGDTAGV